MALVRDNFGKFQKYATIRIAKKLRDDADRLDVDIREKVADKLLDTYKTNVELSYGPRSKAKTKIPYEHTNTFLDSIDVKTEDKKVKIVLNEKKKYPNGRTVKEVYKYLTEGTQGRRSL